MDRMQERGIRKILFRSQVPMVRRQGSRLSGIIDHTTTHCMEVDMPEAVSKTVGYACCYVPTEIIIASGFKPERIIPGGRCAAADEYTYPNICCYVKSILADAAKGAFSHMNAVILANSCDAMRKLFDLWNAYVDRPKALFMDIPKKQDQDASVFFASELNRLGMGLSRMPGGNPEFVEGLNKAIRNVNEVRAIYMDFFDKQNNPEGTIRGSDVFQLIQEPSVLHPPTLREKIAVLVRSDTPKTSASNGKKILVTGNILNNPDLVSMIEAAGGSVTCFDTCFGRKHYELQVEEDTTNPLEALARRYLMKPQCARMMGIADQINHLGRTIDTSRADGVIVTNVKFCDNHTYNVPTVQEAVAASGARCLVLENDYEWSDVEKARIKVETFLEML
jgi:benzoyl-CoA reductase subunit C